LCGGDDKAILPGTKVRGSPTKELFVFDKAYVDRLRECGPRTEEHFYAYVEQILGIMLRARMLTPERVDDVRQEIYSRVIAILRRDGGVKQPERFGALVNSVCKNLLHENNRDSCRSHPLLDEHLEIPVVRAGDYSASVESAAGDDLGVRRSKWAGVLWRGIGGIVVAVPAGGRQQCGGSAAESERFGGAVNYGCVLRRDQPRARSRECAADGEVVFVEK
jgi:hypothetical protein